MKTFPVKTLVLGFLMIVACKKDKDSPVITIEGFDIYDGVGMELGHIGPGDNDWKCISYLTPQELALFDFTMPNVNLNNTVEASITGDRINPFPNPLAVQQSYVMNATDSVLFKYVIVNNKLEVLNRSALKFKGSKVFAIDFSDRKLYPNKGAIRMYFSFSAFDKPNFRAGYGDIKICEGVDNCF